MFAVIYRAYLLPEREQAFRRYWHQVATYFVNQRGALGSALHRGEDGLWVAYSRWPDRTTRDASWPGKDAPSQELPHDVREAVVGLQGCIDGDRALPEICLDLTDDLL